jgi:hypothetical protein
MISEQDSIVKMYNDISSRKSDILEFSENIENYNFGDYIVHSSTNYSSFPDFILEDTGEIVEAKDCKNHSIPSFNSTYPSGEKSISHLEDIVGHKKRKLRQSLKNSGESVRDNMKRDVYYLIRDKNKGEYTISLVHGSYFGDSEAKTISSIMNDIVEDIGVDVDKYESLFEEIRQREDSRRYFSKTRLDDTGIKARFRVMYESSRDMNPHSSNLIPRNSVNIIIPEKFIDNITNLDSIFQNLDIVSVINHTCKERDDRYYLCSSVS